MLAGALGIALACDLVIAKESIRLGCPEINVGAFPFMISALIFRATGRLVANELMMTGRLISAGEAAAAGLVNRVVPDAEFDDAVHSGSPISPANHRCCSAWASGRWRRPAICRWTRRWTICKPNSPWPSPQMTSPKVYWPSRKSVRHSGATHEGPGAGVPYLPGPPLRGCHAAPAMLHFCIE